MTTCERCKILTEALEIARSQVVTLGGEASVSNIWSDQIQAKILQIIDEALIKPQPKNDPELHELYDVWKGK